MGTITCLGLLCILPFLLCVISHSTCFCENPLRCFSLRGNKIIVSWLYVDEFDIICSAVCDSVPNMLLCYGRLHVGSMIVDSNSALFKQKTLFCLCEVLHCSGFFSFFATFLLTHAILFWQTIYLTSVTTALNLNPFFFPPFDRFSGGQPSALTLTLQGSSLPVAFLPDVNPQPAKPGPVTPAEPPPE